MSRNPNPNPNPNVAAGSTQGRGSFNVTEMVQARVDAAGGSFLHISHLEHLPSVFGDPSRGKVKDLTFEYEICGVGGEEHEFEIDGHLLSDLKIEARPQLAPRAGPRLP